MDFLTNGLLKAESGKSKNCISPHRPNAEQKSYQNYAFFSSPQDSPLGNIQNFYLWMVIMLPFSHCSVVLQTEFDYLCFLLED